MGSSIVKLAYVNNSGMAIHPFGVIQMDGEPATTASGGIVFNAIRPSGTDGMPYFIDDGGGAGISGPTSYGSCFRAADGAVWAAFSGVSAPTPWSEVGPVSGSFAMSTSGRGYFYAGKFDGSNNRILVVAKPSANSLELCHGIIIAQCNPVCSTYRVQRVHRYIRPDCDGSGSGSGP